MKLNRRSLLLAAPAALHATECVQIGPVETGAFEILAFDAADAPIEPVEFEYASVYDPVIRFRLASERPTKLPYGPYLLKVRATGFSTHQLLTSLSQPITTLRVTLKVGAECFPQVTTIRGTLRGVPRPSDLWVKAIPIRGAASIEARVTPSGYFLLPGLDFTEHILLVLRGSTVIHHQTVRAAASPYTDVLINLAG